MTSFITSSQGPCDLHGADERCGVSQSGLVCRLLQHMHVSLHPSPILSEDESRINPTIGGSSVLSFMFETCSRTMKLNQHRDLWSSEFAHLLVQYCAPPAMAHHDVFKGATTADTTSTLFGNDVCSRENLLLVQKQAETQIEILTLKQKVADFQDEVARAQQASEAHYHLDSSFHGRLVYFLGSERSFYGLAFHPSIWSLSRPSLLTNLTDLALGLGEWRNRPTVREHTTELWQRFRLYLIDTTRKGPAWTIYPLHMMTFPWIHLNLS